MSTMRTALCAAVAASLFFLVGCSSRYVVVTDDYTVHEATSEPAIDAKSDTVTFEDKSGSKVTLPRSQLKQIKEID